MEQDIELIRRSGGEHDLKRSAWERVLAHWRESGLSASAFCRLHGLSTKRLYQWRKRLAAPLGQVGGSALPRLVEVTCTPDDLAGASAAVVQIELASAIVRLPYEGSAAQLVMILRSLKEAAC